MKLPNTARMLSVLSLLLTLPAHAEYTIILTSCEFTSDSPERKAQEYVQIRRTYLSLVGTDNPVDQITYQGLMVQHSGGGAPDTDLTSETVIRTPEVPIIPKKFVQFQDGEEFNLIIDLQTLQGTFAYNNSTTTQPVSCSPSGDGKYW